MPELDVKAELDGLGQLLLLWSPGENEGLSGTVDTLGILSRWAEGEEKPRLARALQASAEKIEELIKGTCADQDMVIELVSQALSQAQRLLDQDLDDSMVAFPEMLVPAAPVDKSELAPVDDDLLFDFLDRQMAGMDQLEADLVGLEKEESAGAVDRIKGLLHTLKGEAGFLGLNSVHQLCHQTETALEEQSASELVEYLLAARDWLARAFISYREGGGDPEGLEQLQECLAGPDRKDAQDQPDQPEQPDQAELPAGNTALVTDEEDSAVADEKPAPKMPDKAMVPLEGDPELLADFVTEATEHLEASDMHLLALEADPAENEALNGVFRAFHTIKGIAGFLDLGQIQALAHQAENMLDRARKGTLRLDRDNLAVVFDALDMLKVLTVQVGEALESGGDLPVDPEVDRLLERIANHLDDQDEVGGGGSAKKEQLPAANPPPREQPQSSPSPAKETDRVGAGTATRKGTAVKESLRVDADRLDQLVDTIGELVIAESMVTQSATSGEVDQVQLSRNLSHLGKITRELQELGMSLRMVPLKSTFQKMARLVRDVAKKNGKEVEFRVEGEDTELDKSVVDQIGDPLVHMMRNAVDHGLEATPEDREKAGKSRQGQVTLRAYHKGGCINIEIADDGRGLDAEVIRAKAVERGLIREDEGLTKQECWKLIFEPGFSTAKQITDVSGRGVGMDVVRKSIEALRGRIEIDSRKGEGTTFAIALPLTLAIIDGMNIKVGRESLIIPTLSIMTSIHPSPEDVLTVKGKGEMFKYRDRMLPLFRVGELFGIQECRQRVEEGVVVVVEANDKTAGFLVDELLGQQQIVIKTLGSTFENVGGLAGAAIMGDGTVGLILDVASMVNLATGASEGTE